MKSGIEIDLNITNVFLFICVVFKKCKFKWPKNLYTIKRKLTGDPEIMREYNSQWPLFFNTSPIKLAKYYKVEIIVDKDDKTLSYGKGPSIFFKFKTSKWFLFPFETNFYTWPRGVMLNNKLYQRLDEILIFRGLLSENDFIEPCP
jgi:hypothetical protein